jgi:RHS repeat-associated protein
MDLRFPGQWFQLENGLAYNWHRHYDPTIGRYIQPDPLGLKALLSDGPSVYNYVGGNPLAKIDPSGTTGIETGGGSPIYLPDSNAVYRLIQQAFRNATPTGSALKDDAYHKVAEAERCSAIDNGKYFITPRNDGLGYVLLLQAEVNFNGKDGIVEYVIPLNTNMFTGAPNLTHQTFIPDGPISGQTNNWYGRKFPPWNF